MISNIPHPVSRPVTTARIALIGPAPNLSLATGDDAPLARAVSRKDAVLIFLRRAIIEGRLAPGERLDPEALASRLGCSRMPVRDALKVLEAEGLVSCYPSRGTRVSRLDAGEIEQVFGIRLALETLALRRAVPRLTGTELAVLREILDRMDGEWDAGGWFALNEAFHARLNAASGWPRLVEQIEVQRRNIERYVRVRIRGDGLDAPQREHRALLAACAARDEAQACAILEAHLSRTARMIASEGAGQDTRRDEDLGDG